jgi:hypothetical protein
MGLGDALLVWMAIGFIVVVGGGTYAAAHLGSWMAGIDSPPKHPIDLIAGLVKDRVPWPVQSTVAAVLSWPAWSWSWPSSYLWPGGRVPPSVPASTRRPGTWVEGSPWLRSPRRARKRRRMGWE